MYKNMYEQVYQPKKNNSKKTIIIIIAIIFTIIISTCISVFIYLNQIVEVNAVNIRTKQFQQVKFPETVIVKLRNNTTKTVKVNWDTVKINTEVEDVTYVTGKINKYNKEVKAIFEVYSYINKIDEVNVRTFDSDTKLVLPEKIKTTTSNGIISEDKVKWNTDAIDMRKAGTYKVEGIISSKYEQGVPAYCNLEILSKDQALNKIVEPGYDGKRNEIISANNLIKTLPSKVLNKIIDNEVKISYVPNFIGESIKKVKSDGGLKAIGVFYPDNQQIQVDYEIPNNMVDKYNSCSIAAIHEIGHAFDFNRKTGNFELALGIKKDSLNTKEGIKLFNSEFSRSYELSLYFITSPEEYFAECFSFYYTSPELRQVLQAKAPLTYEYVKMVTSDSK